MIVNYTTSKIYELLDIETGDIVILSSVLKFKSFVLYSLRKILNNYLKSCYVFKMKAFKTTADILLKNNYKLNLIEQRLESTTKQDVEQKVADIKRPLPNINDLEKIFSEALTLSKPETLLKNDIVIETKKYLN